MRDVLDPSGAFKWVVPEHDSDKANLLRQDYRNGLHELLAPDIFTGEVGHTLTRSERRGRIQVGEALPLLTDVLQTCPALHSSQPLLLRACEISSQTRVGFFDCLYVALAEREQCQFVTADDRVVRNLQPVFPFILTLAAIP